MNFNSKNSTNTKVSNKKMNETKFVELIFISGHNNGGFVNKKVWDAFLLFLSQLVVTQGSNSIFGENWE